MRCHFYFYFPVCVCVYTHLWRLENSLRNTCHRVSHWPEAHRFAQTDWLWVQRISPSLPPQSWDCKHLPQCLAFLHGFWGSNSGPHAGLQGKPNISPGRRFHFYGTKLLFRNMVKFLLCLSSRLYLLIKFCCFLPVLSFVMVVIKYVTVFVAIVNERTFYYIFQRLLSYWKVLAFAPSNTKPLYRVLYVLLFSSFQLCHLYVTIIFSL